MTFKQKLKDFLRDNATAGATSNLDENEDLIARGLIDSIALLQIILFIEEQVGIRIPDEEVAPENFQTINAIERTVERLQAQSQSSVAK
jgi:acyl carrier protein